MRRYTILILSLFLSVAVIAQESTNLFIGTYTTNGSYGIYIAKFNAANGTITVIDSIAAENPSYLALNKAGNRLYAVTENGKDKPGSVSAFGLNESTQKWTLINTQPSGGDHPCYVSVDSKNRFAMLANYTSGSLAVLPIDNAGALQSPVQVLQQTGHSVNEERQQSPHVHTAVFSPKENYVVMTDLGADFVKAYRYDSKKTQPLDTTKIIAIPSRPGAGPRHVAFNPAMQVFYVMEELSGNISVYSFNKRNIVWLQTVKADSISSKPGSADIHVSADGRYVYATHRSDANTITVFKTNPESGHLSWVGKQSTMGIMPRNFTIDPSGKWILVAHQKSGNIVVFAVDPSTGMPVPTQQEIKIPSPVCLVFAR